MTNEEVIKYFKSQLPPRLEGDVDDETLCSETDDFQAKVLAIKAFEKVEQLEKENRELKELLTPKKPINVTYDDGYIEYWNCPHCHIQHSDNFTLFCDNCGQALDV